MKLTPGPGVNFINILQTALTLTDPESSKKTVKLSVFFLHFGDLWAKKLLVECWWNWPHVTFGGIFRCKQVWSWSFFLPFPNSTDLMIVYFSHCCYCCCCCCCSNCSSTPWTIVNINCRGWLCKWILQPHSVSNVKQ